MSDADLRELERRFRATGSVEAEAAWLGARVQAGQLERSKLELAAFLADPASRLACGGLSPSETESEPKGWDHRMASFGLEASVRAALVYVLELRVTRWWKRDPDPWEDALLHALSWLDDPRGTSGDTLIKVAAGLPVRVNCATFSMQYVRETLVAIGKGEALIASAVANALGEGELYAKVGETLVPWALGYSDPLLEAVVGSSTEDLPAE